MADVDSALPPLPTRFHCAAPGSRAHDTNALCAQCFAHDPCLRTTACCCSLPAASSRQPPAPIRCLPSITRIALPVTRACLFYITAASVLISYSITYASFACRRVHDNALPVWTATRASRHPASSVPSTEGARFLHDSLCFLPSVACIDESRRATLAVRTDELTTSASTEVHSQKDCETAAGTVNRDNRERERECAYDTQPHTPHLRHTPSWPCPRRTCPCRAASAPAAPRALALPAHHPHAHPLLCCWRRPHSSSTLRPRPRAALKFTHAKAGERMKKQALLCFFCRERKIAYGRPEDGSVDRRSKSTCTVTRPRAALAPEERRNHADMDMPRGVGRCGLRVDQSSTDILFSDPPGPPPPNFVPAQVHHIELERSTRKLYKNGFSIIPPLPKLRYNENPQIFPDLNLFWFNLK
ncbi:hypothetical protein GGX14DRAFT_384984 [Mycena pura]|uniref:Uncharacterized protein n=1 Tax=Mycena pura TaxID=153505 RepID=A0AAD6YTE5_9AGAR|nr:hypothetical protein GGX14DRAFT_384984 [Mycena pura]